MIDLHTHLTDAAFAADRPQVLARAWEAGLRAVVVVGQDVEENQAVLELACREARVLPFLGWHPDRYADSRTLPEAAAEDAVEAQLSAQAGRIAGIGEVGLDRWVCQNEERRVRQAELFARLVRLALRLDLPLNVHSRSAGERTLALLCSHGARRVLMHAFDGRAAKALAGVEAGYLFSIPPSILRSPQKQKLVRALPLASLALETDSPVLGPRQGERNEPANLRLSLHAIAELKGLAVQEVREALYENSLRLLGERVQRGGSLQNACQAADLPHSGVIPA